ncbi:ABC transporter substrate-binding protein [Anaerosporobacter sp.]|uniref:ABC transporter substrate-binding protein n=1 Tax=Anaerosporobacter sp. TaxID=1872529 RepID=UPI00286F549E|nr:ABC transporter substrate-binding protein [Anaerosporobacter sp.]
MNNRINKNGKRQERKFGRKSKLIISTLLLLAMALNLVACQSKNKNNNQAVQTTSKSKDSADTEAKDTEVQDTDTKPTELKVVKLASPTQDGNFVESAKIAQAQGYIEEELAAVGYKPEYIAFAQAGPAINEALVAKEVDIAVYGDLPIITLRSNGGKIKVFAAANTEYQFGILAAPGVEIKEPKDLEGKKVILGKGTVAHYYYYQLVKNYNLDESKIQLINANADSQSILATGDADALIYTLFAEKYYETIGVGTVVNTSYDTPERTAQFLVAGREEYLEKNRDVAKAIIRALNRAQEYAASDEKGAYKALAGEGSKIPESVYEDTYNYDTTFSYFKPELTKESQDKIVSLIDFAYENGLIQEKVDINDLIDTSYYEEVLAESK